MPTVLSGTRNFSMPHWSRKMPSVIRSASNAARNSRGRAMSSMRGLLCDALEEVPDAGCAFELEQLSLDVEAAAEPGQRAVATDHAMARHDNRQRIRAVREPDGPRCQRMSDAAGELAVRDRLAVWDLDQRPP